MTCPFCTFQGHRMALHAHLVNEHPDQVKISTDLASGKLLFEMRCPLCDKSVRQLLKKSAEMLSEYHREIRMVAFDLLLYHLMEFHPEDQPPG